MKKKALLLLAITAITSSVFAQDKKVRLGLTLFPTLNVFKPDVDAIEKTKNGMGFSYGLLIDYNFGDNYAFSTGLHINTTKGSVKYKDVAYPNEDRSINAPASTEATYALKYIDIPLTLKLKTNEIGYITYYGQFGLGLGVNIKARQDIETTYGPSNQTLNDEDIDIASDIRLFRTALVVGAGIEYGISGNTAIQVGFTFNNGFSNILSGNVPEVDSNGDVVTDANNNIVDSSQKRSATNNYFALNVGIFF